MLLVRALALASGLLLVSAGLGLGQTLPPGPDEAVAQNRGGPDLFMRALRTLRLRPEQHRRIRELIASFNQHERDVTDRVQRHVDRRQLHADIEGVLTPQQRDQLESTILQMNGTAE